MKMQNEKKKVTEPHSREYGTKAEQKKIYDEQPRVQWKFITDGFQTYLTSTMRDAEAVYKAVVAPVSLAHQRCQNEIRVLRFTQ